MPADGLLGGRRSNGLTLGSSSAAVLVAVILVGMYFALLWVQIHLKQYPFLVLLFPPVAVAALAIIIPLLIFISFQADFKGLNPWNPVHLFVISRRCYTAMANNNLKVSEKDL